MNVLLLALSTIPNNGLTKSEYQYEEEEAFEGYYQLEPIPKFLNDRLKKDNQKLDCIITFNTNEVNTTIKTVSPLNENLTAKDLFEKMLVQGDKKFSSLPQIISIDINVDKILPGIIEAITQLRMLKKKENNLHLYIDMHGGPRNTQMTFQTILSLLKHENIAPEKIYTIIMNQGKPNTIKDDTKYFDFIDFVSGMNEFLNFGKPISMKEQFLSEDKNLKEFSKKANNIADSLTLCDMDGFQKGLLEMSEWLNHHDIEDDSMLELFKNNIDLDYGVLLKKDHDVIDEIDWCLKKGYLQQAMTLIESKMPGELLKKGIISYDENEMVREEVKNGFKKSYSGDRCSVKEVIQKGKKISNRNWELDINYIFIKWIVSILNYDLLPLDKKRNEYISFTYDREPFFNRKARIDIMKDKKNKINKYYDVNIDCNSRIFSSNKHRAVLIRFLLLHNALKQERNKINHAENVRRYSKQDIEAAIGGYIDLARKLYKV